MIYSFFRPFLFASDPEHTHERLIALGSSLAHSPFQKLLAHYYGFEDSCLETSLWGLDFKNPVGLAAGFDKNGRLMDFLPALGFGFIEVGTVTPLAQVGNERPRLFRLPKDQAIINRMGFNNEGVQALVQRLATRRTRIPVGANIGKNKATPQEDAIDDYERCFEAVADTADYIVINVSSPNTPNLRALQEKEVLEALLRRLTELNRMRTKPLPLVLKIAPDLTDEALEDVAATALALHIDGIIATNTTISREGLATAASRVKEIGAGGLSGTPVKRRATEVIAFLFKRLGHAIPIIGVGGICSAEDAYEKIVAGASLIQVWTGLVYKGPSLVRKINKGLTVLLKRDGFHHISEAVGTGIKN